MFVFDENMADMVLAYCKRRLDMDPVPLDYGGLTGDSLDQALEGLMRPAGNEAAMVFTRFVEILARGVVSCDSPRFLSFIPAAPTKASLLFDMVVSCSSLQGTSWLESAGAVAAENQALRVLADLIGYPEGAGGCFVSGGSIANLSALVVARDRPGRPAITGPARMAVSADAHSSVEKALRVIGVGGIL